MKIDSDSGPVIISHFIESMKDSLGVISTAVISASPFHVFSEVEKQNTVVVETLDELPKGDTYDLVLGDFPLGMKLEPLDLASNRKAVRFPGNWIYIYNSLSKLAENGVGLFLVEPHGFSTIAGRKFLKLMGDTGYFLNAVFNTPVDLLKPMTAIVPVIVAISRKNSEYIFVGELSNTEQSVVVHDNYVRSNNSETIEYGTYIRKCSFKGFKQLRALHQIDRLETQYNQFEKYTVGEIGEEINAVRSGQSHKERNNAIYIPKLGTSAVVANLDDATLKHHNYFQVVLNEKATNQYVAPFFASEIGKLVLQSLSTSSYIPHINKKDLEQAIVALPSITEQNEIAETHKRLNILKEEIDRFDKEISINPTSSRKIQTQLDALLESIGSLSEADWLRGMVRQGESKTVEFKETLSFDVKKKTKEKYLETSSLKTIVAFLNSDGGVLAIGVADSGTIPGLNTELEKFHKNNLDNFFKHLKNLLKNRIGEQFYPYFDYKIIDVDGNPVLIFDCKSSKDPCFLDGEDFYVRTNPATDKLEGPKLLEYVKHHFVE